MVEKVEKLGAELQIHLLVERKREILEYGQIRVHEARTVNGRAGSGAELTNRESVGGALVDHRRRRSHEGTGIEPIRKRMNPRGSNASWIRRDGSWLVGVPDLIRALNG